MLYKNIRYLIACYHVVNSEIKKLNIEILNESMFNFELKNHYIKYFEKLFDITLIKLNNTDEFINYIVI